MTEEKDSLLNIGVDIQLTFSSAVYLALAFKVPYIQPIL